MRVWPLSQLFEPVLRGFVPILTPTCHHRQTWLDMSIIYFRGAHGLCVSPLFPRSLQGHWLFLRHFLCLLFRQRPHRITSTSRNSHQTFQIVGPSSYCRLSVGRHHSPNIRFQTSAPLTLSLASLAPIGLEYSRDFGCDALVAIDS